MNREIDRKYTIEDLKIMQNWPLDRKIMVSQAKILEFGAKFEDKMYILSFTFLTDFYPSELFGNSE